MMLTSGVSVIWKMSCTSAMLCQLVGNDRNLESTRNPYCGDVVVLHTMAHQAIHCSVQELLDNNLVETGSYNSNLHSLRSN